MWNLLATMTDKNHVNLRNSTNVKYYENMDNSLKFDDITFQISIVGEVEGYLVKTLCEN